MGTLDTQYPAGMQMRFLQTVRSMLRQCSGSQSNTIPPKTRRHIRLLRVDKVKPAEPANSCQSTERLQRTIACSNEVAHLDDLERFDFDLRRHPHAGIAACGVLLLHRWCVRSVETPLAHIALRTQHLELPLCRGIMKVCEAYTPCMQIDCCYSSIIIVGLGQLLMSTIWCLSHFGSNMLLFPHLRLTP